MDKTKILFVCLGNICRSPAAEEIMRHLVIKRGEQDGYEIDSAGTYGGHVGQLPDGRMRAHAIRRGYTLSHSCRKVCYNDFDLFDYIIGMDDANYYDLCDMAPTAEAVKKVHRMSEYVTHYDVDCIPDPYYDGAEGFENVLTLLEDGCDTLLRQLQNNKSK